MRGELGDGRLDALLQLEDSRVAAVRVAAVLMVGGIGIHAALGHEELQLVQQLCAQQRGRELDVEEGREAHHARRARRRHGQPRGLGGVEEELDVLAHL
eukprot:scaffold35173_cov63-Phaeocystis_antarctica.AAC.9